MLCIIPNMPMPNNSRYRTYTFHDMEDGFGRSTVVKVPKTLYQRSVKYFFDVLYFLLSIITLCAVLYVFSIFVTYVFNAIVSVDPHNKNPKPIPNIGEVHDSYKQLILELTNPVISFLRGFFAFIMKALKSISNSY